jgi:Ca-activated chloride channel family protein
VLTGAVHASAQQPPVFRGGVDLVNLGLTVTDRRGALITDLTAADVEIYEDGVRQTVQYFAAGGGTAGAPELHLGVLLDVSESMQQDIEFTRTAAIKFLNTLPDAVDITVVDFDTEVRAARFAQSDFPRLVERIRRQKVKGWTAMYDAVAVYVEGAAGLSGRKVMLLCTDGGDTRSALRLGDVLDLLKASDVTLFAIGSLDHQSAFGRNEQRSVLLQMAEATGGQAFFVSSVKQLDKVYAQIVGEIRAQYTVGYASSNVKADGQWREVKVRLTRADARNLRVRARKGYYARHRPQP